MPARRGTRADERRDLNRPWEEPSCLSPCSTGAPRSTTHVHGRTVITQEPQRVVSVGFNDQDPIVALGVVPVGVADWRGDENATGFPCARERYGADPPALLGLFYELNFEEVAALRPDVIIGVSGLERETFDALSRIAPTVAQPPGPEDRFVGWQETQLVIGRVLGREGRARELVAEVESEFNAARAAHPEFDGATVVFLDDLGDMVRARGTNEVWTQALISLGFTVPPGIVGTDHQDMSFEQLGVLNDVDVLVSPAYGDVPLADNPPSSSGWTWPGRDAASSWTARARSSGRSRSAAR